MLYFCCIFLNSWFFWLYESMYYDRVRASLMAVWELFARCVPAVSGELLHQRRSYQGQCNLCIVDICPPFISPHLIPYFVSTFHLEFRSFRSVSAADSHCDRAGCQQRGAVSGAGIFRGCLTPYSGGDTHIVVLPAGFAQHRLFSLCDSSIRGTCCWNWLFHTFFVCVILVSFHCLLCLLCLLALLAGLRFSCWSSCGHTRVKAFRFDFVVFCCFVFSFHYTPIFWQQLSVRFA